MNIISIGKKLLVFTIVLSLFSFIHFVFNNEPEISLDEYQIEKGFQLNVVATNPHIEAPVAMDFDDKGRMWVVEMRGYMPNLEGLGEEEPIGRISILEDRDLDGKVEHSKVFMDGLVLPRAIAHVYGGLLYTDGPALYFVKIKRDKPGKKTLVDPIYADGGNVEHQPNGLMMNIDNWIYNANTHFRYQMKDGKWIKEPSSYRGQWGITKDNFGRLYVNNNSTQIQGDHVLPNTTMRNPYYKPRYSVNQTLTRNQNVYPLHATAVNRGYQKGVLDENGLLRNVTAACGPLVYRGGNFPDSYNQNAFVCIPEANVIKRNILEFESTEVKATQAWDNKEFLSSTDEGFRPVNLYNGPDGALYIVDMHRGIIQHKAFISQYLTNLLAERKLDTLQHQGRILKVVSTEKVTNEVPNLTKYKAKELVNLLNSPNGWLRDRAQQMLIQKNAKSIKDELWTLTKVDNSFATSIHALYVLEGLKLLTFDKLVELLISSKSPETTAHTLILLESFCNEKYTTQMEALSTKVLAKKNSTTDLYLAIAIKPWIKTSPKYFLGQLSEISQRYPSDKVVQEAVLSSLESWEDELTKNYLSSALLKQFISETLKNKEKNELNSIYVMESRKDDNRTNGLKLYRTICGACHGADGTGIADLAPPLKNSEYIDGSIHRLASIILHGISGPIHVNGQLYELNNDMPALTNNSEISDQDVVDIVQFLQNAFAKEGKRISANEVKKLRSEKPKEGLYSEKELLEKIFEK